jgi:hypothetical protein
MRRTLFVGIFLLSSVACGVDTTEDGFGESEDAIRALNPGERLGSLAFGEVKTFSYANTDGNKYRSFTFRARAGERVVASVLAANDGSTKGSAFPLVWIARATGSNLASTTRDGWAGPADTNWAAGQDFRNIDRHHASVFAVIPSAGEYRIVIREGANQPAKMAVAVQTGCDPDDEGWNTSCAPPFVPDPSMKVGPVVDCAGELTPDWVSRQMAKPTRPVPGLFAGLLAAPLGQATATDWTRTCDVLKCAPWVKGESRPVESYVAMRGAPTLAFVDRQQNNRILVAELQPPTTDVTFVPVSQFGGPAMTGPAMTGTVTNQCASAKRPLSPVMGFGTTGMGLTYTTTYSTTYAGE